MDVKELLKLAVDNLEVAEGRNLVDTYVMRSIAASLAVIAQAAAMWMGENEQIAKIILDKAQSVASVTGIPNADERLTEESPAADPQPERPFEVGDRVIQTAAHDESGEDGTR